MDRWADVHGVDISSSTGRGPGTHTHTHTSTPYHAMVTDMSVHVPVVHCEIPPPKTREWRYFWSQDDVRVDYLPRQNRQRETG
mmetsp:Transcript_26782/g.66643  ORF Transcript_26782/g.66643 Transcript_26782/m.66643 type:complete len:83 (-) Transcript_26782:60-308(-)